MPRDEKKDAAPDVETRSKDCTMKDSILYSTGTAEMEKGDVGSCTSSIAPKNKQIGGTVIEGTVKKSSPVMKQEARHGSVFQYFGVDDWSAHPASKYELGSRY